MAECGIGAGSDRILQLTPRWMTFYAKPGGAPICSTFINTFFGHVSPGDPVAHYDAARGRYLMVAMGLGDTDPTRGQDTVFLAISKPAGDPCDRANWWIYTILASEGRDYPGLGLSEDKIVLRWATDRGPFNRLYVIDRAKAYDNLFGPGEPLGDTLSADELGNYKPSRNLTADSTVYMVAKGSTGIRVQRITGSRAAGNLTISTAEEIPLTFQEATIPTGADQPDTSAFATCEPRRLGDRSHTPTEVYKRGGTITTSWMYGRDYGDGNPPTAAVRCVRFRLADHAVLEDFSLGSPGISYSYPSAVEDVNGTIFVGFNRAHPMEYASCYMVARRGGQQSPEFLVQNGRVSYMNCRDVTIPFATCNQFYFNTPWGDYTATAIDELASNAVQTRAYFAGLWTVGVLTPGTAFGTLVANYGAASIAGTVLSDSAGIRTARSGAPLELVESASGSVVALATSDAAGAFTFGSLPANTYTLRMAWNPGVALTATAGTGGTSQIVLGPSAIQIVVSGSQASVGNQFVVTRQAPPAITSLSPVNVIAGGADFQLVVSGTGFSSLSEVRFDGRRRPTTFDSGSGQLRASISHYDIARSGSRAITVFTPASAGAGLSAAAAFPVLPQFVVSASLPARVVACPAGDAGHLTGTVVVRPDAGCGMNPASATGSMSLGLVISTTLRNWDVPNTIGAPFDTVYALYTVPATKTIDPVTGWATFTYDASHFSGCGLLPVALKVTNTSGFSVTVLQANVEMRSPDLDRKVRASVDRFDLDVLAAMIGSPSPCGDLNQNGWVDSSDLAFFAAHHGHHAFPRHVTSPNGGEVYTRGSGSIPPIPIQWETGFPTTSSGPGDSAFVTINIVDGSLVQLVAGNERDDGSFTWTNYCNIGASSNKKIEVIHHAGIFHTGDVTLGSDQSDNPFTIGGSCGGGHGCPFLDTWVAGRWQEENSLLARSTKGEMGRDLYRLSGAPDLTPEGSLRLRLREDEQERTRLASAGLVTVDRDPAQSSWVQDGRIVVGTRAPVAKVVTASGEDLTARLTRNSAEGLECAPGTILNVELYPIRPGGDPAAGSTVRRGGLVVRPSRKEFARTPMGPGGNDDSKVLERTGIIVQRPDGHGGWIDVTRWYPREKAADFAVGTGRELRLVFVGRHWIHDLAWAQIDSESPADVKLAATTARHNRLGEIAARLEEAANDEVTISPGERVELTFRVPPVPEGRARDYYFAARGVYTTLPGAIQAVDLPKQNELYAARPNPTDGTVQFGFGLPKPGQVRISIYDVAGRLVARPTDGYFEAGRQDLSWDLRDRTGTRVKPGLYFYRMEVGRWRQHRKLVVN